LYSSPGIVASWIDERWVEQQRALLPPAAFARVIENVWTSGQGDYLSRDSWRRIVDPGLRPVASGKARRHFGALDLGLSKDRTGLAICHLEDERVVLDSLEAWEGSVEDPVSILAVENAVEDAYRRFPGLRMTLDPWQAESTFQKLKRAGRAVEKFTFSAKSIHGLSTALYQAVQDETLRVFEDRELEAEVLALQVRETPEGWRFDHRAGGFSDRVVALAMALQAALARRRAGTGRLRTSGLHRLGRASLPRREPRPENDRLVQWIQAGPSRGPWR
jgi:phage terminase large subunit-like protein